MPHFSGDSADTRRDCAVQVSRGCRYFKTRGTASMLHPIQQFVLTISQVKCWFRTFKNIDDALIDHGIFDTSRRVRHTIAAPGPLWPPSIPFSPCAPPAMCPTDPIGGLANHDSLTSHRRSTSHSSLLRSPELSAKLSAWSFSDREPSHMHQPGYWPLPTVQLGCWSTQARSSLPPARRLG